MALNRSVHSLAESLFSSAKRKRRKNDRSNSRYGVLEPRNLLAGLVITEFVASNGESYVDDNGNTTDWIELYNDGPAINDLSNYSLTDDPSDPTKFVLPNISLGASQHLVVIAGDDQQPNSGTDIYTGFGLSASGEYLGLYGAFGNVLSEFEVGGADYPTQITDVSYGVAFGGNFDQVSYFATPTPGSPNSNPVAGVVEQVSASIPAGFYEATQSVSLSTPTSGATIRYTTDGSTPSANNGFTYTGPISITATTTLRAVGTRSGYLSVPDRTWSYFFVDDIIDQSSDGVAPTNFPAVGSFGSNGQKLDYGIDPQVIGIEGEQAVKDALLAIPTWSITTDIDNLFDPNTGIYANPLQDGNLWEREASVELLNPDGSEGFQVNAGLRIRGGFSRLESNAKHSFRLFFRSEYGDSELEYPVHGDTGVDTFDRLDLRTAQNYSWSKDGDPTNNFIVESFNRENQLALGQPSTRSSWLHLYLNGQYWGLYQTQERVDNNFAADYLGGDPDDYDVIKPDAGPNKPYTNAATEGTLDAYERLYDQAIARAADGTTPAFADNAAYYRAQGLNPDGTPNPNFETLLDVDNVIDYMMLIFHSGNFDAPITQFGNPSNARLNNYNAIRSRTGDHGFQFFVHDAEHSYKSVDEDRTGPYNNSNLETGVAFFNPQWLHQQLMANDEYLIAFADRIQEVFFNDGVLSQDNLLARYDALAAQIDQAIIGESARWGDVESNTPRTRSNWETAVADLREDILSKRLSYFLEQMRTTEMRLRFTASSTSFSRVVDAPLLPSVEAPVFLVDEQPQHGGVISAGQELQLTTNSEGTIYYTTDGIDPREVGGTVSSTAQIADGMTTTSTLFTAGSTWQYLDIGQDQGTAWREPGFNDNAWKTGVGRFGFGEPGSDTTVNSGPQGNRYVTTYFRKEFTADGDYDFASLSINRDDGVVVYVNGTEVVRDNLPTGTITYGTFANGPIGGETESEFVPFVIPASCVGRRC